MLAQSPLLISTPSSSLFIANFKITRKSTFYTIHSRYYTPISTATANANTINSKPSVPVPISIPSLTSKNHDEHGKKKSNRKEGNSISQINVPRQKYIPVSKSELLHSLTTFLTDHDHDGGVGGGSGSGSGSGSGDSVVSHFLLLASLVHSTIDTTDVLYSHPNETINTLNISPKLTGVENYIPWKRSMELALSTKKKLGFVLGTVTKPSTDNTRMEAWDSANNLVISWLIHNVSDPIKIAVMYIPIAHEIWKILKNRYLVTNGARKYKLNKEIYDMKQKGKSVIDYYIQLKTIWDELENLNDYPIVTQVNNEIRLFMEAIEKQKEEARLFQFLNGLDAVFSTQRSATLLMSPLPKVDDALSIMVQEEAQQSNIQNPVDKVETEATAFMGKGETTEESCKHCGYNNHPTEKCWFAPGNSRPSRGARSGGRNQFRGGQRGRGRNAYNYQNNQTQGYNQGYNQQKGNREGGFRKNAHLAQSEPSNAELAASLKELQMLLKQSSDQKSNKTSIDTDDELECNFTGLFHK